jgi:lipid II:glycine glycyltransferase (peptidoglycan interpeptide bridge formation enzyme)
LLSPETKDNGTVHLVDHLRDSRWTEFLENNPSASVFHAPEWLEALRRTYGYEPVVLTTSAPGERLTNGLVFCRVRSWLTGTRMVSLPFSDHCEPLVRCQDEIDFLLSGLKSGIEACRLKYVEIRSVNHRSISPADLEPAETFCLHRLDLRPTLEELVHGFHKHSIRQMIRRAEREGLSYEEGQSESLLNRFYRLTVLTRQRQQLPPPPLSWFRNLIACMGDKLKIRLASKDGQPVASILTLRYKTVLVYKYGCSDRKFFNLGGTQFLLWKTIQEAKNNRLLELDMGRSAWNNPGLITFKDRWGAARSVLGYLRYPQLPSRGGIAILGMRIAKPIISMAPGGVLSTAGSVLYRHFG